LYHEGPRKPVAIQWAISASGLCCSSDVLMKNRNIKKTTAVVFDVSIKGVLEVNVSYEAV
jgi:hypothetical protein